MAKITRIKAKDPGAAPETTTGAASQAKTKKSAEITGKDQKSLKKAQKAEKKALRAAKRAEKAQKPTKNPIRLLGRYFKNSWTEIRQVRWPNRAATWKMVLAVLVYTALLVVLITLLDALFTFIFNKLLG